MDTACRPITCSLAPEVQLCNETPDDGKDKRHACMTDDVGVSCKHACTLSMTRNFICTAAFQEHCEVCSMLPAARDYALCTPHICCIPSSCQLWGGHTELFEIVSMHHHALAVPLYECC